MLLGLRRIAVVWLFCLSWKFSGGTMPVNSKSKQDKLGKHGNVNGINHLGNILGSMQKIMNIALKSPRDFKGDVMKFSANVCPSFKCVKEIPKNCRESVYYIIKGKRCIGCDIDICKVQMRKRKRHFSRDQNSLFNHANRIQNTALSVQSGSKNSRSNFQSGLNFQNRIRRPSDVESRWLLGSRGSFNQNTRNNLRSNKIRNSIQGDSLSRNDLQDIDISQFPPGAENSWITSPFF